ncbi:MAG: FtsX-like permease family protein [Planctomycetes bacterium]|nr:FtsX-like permease family protein [Planctomycetota bacterium]
MPALILRYLLTRRIALLAVVAISLGVMAMIVILALMAGVQHFLVDHFRHTQADLVLVHEDRGAAQEAAIRHMLLPELSPQGPLVALSARTETLALLIPKVSPDPVFEERIEGVRVWGVDWSEERQVTPLNDMLAAVKDANFAVPMETRADPLGAGGIILGDALAAALGVTGPAGPGPHEVTLALARATTGADGKPAFDETRTAVVRVVGTISSGHAEHDRTVALMDRKVLRTLKHPNPARATDPITFHARIDPDADAAEIVAGLRQRQPELIVQTFVEAHRSELLAIEDQKRIMLVILSSVIAVAAVAILGMVWLMVKEKTRDIGILRSMGLARWRIVVLFSGYGLLLGAGGTLCGLLLGLLVAQQIDPIVNGLSALAGVELLNPAVYRFETIPVRFEADSIGTVLLIALGASLVASIIPALRAASLDPVRCLRAE